MKIKVSENTLNEVLEMFSISAKQLGKSVTGVWEYSGECIETFRTDDVCLVWERLRDLNLITY